MEVRIGSRRDLQAGRGMQGSLGGGGRRAGEACRQAEVPVPVRRLAASPPRPAASSCPPPLCMAPPEFDCADGQLGPSRPPSPCKRMPRHTLHLNSTVPTAVEGSMGVKTK